MVIYRTVLSNFCSIFKVLILPGRQSNTKTLNKEQMKLRFKLLTILSFLLPITGLYAQEQTASPLNFIQNDGQWEDHIVYQSNIGGGNVWLEPNTFTFLQYHAEDLADFNAHDHSEDEDPFAHEKELLRAHAWKMHFVNGNADQIAGFDKISTYHNYFLGNDPSKWAGHVPLFNGVQYGNIWDGIDIDIKSVNGNFKYDLILAPNADAGQIKMEYEGLEGLRIVDGSLILETSIGEFTELAPYAYQDINGEKIEVKCNYVVDGNNVSFEFPEGYNQNEKLVIDPVLVAATLSSSTVTNWGHSATYDTDGNIYTGARNFGAGYPATVGAFQTAFGGGGTDMGLSKISPDGTTLIWASFLGGSSGEYPHSTVTNGNGELFVLGTSESANYPVSGTAFDSAIGGSKDIVITHFTADGSGIEGSTYVGGGGLDGNNTLSFNYGDDFRGEIIIDNGGNALVAACTNSPDFPTTAGAYQENYGGGLEDGVVFSMTGDLSTMNWSTFVGGSGHEVCFGLRTNDNGNVFVSGATDNGFLAATGYQTTYQGGASDGFAIELQDDGSAVLNSTYWGTADGDYAFFLNIGVDDAVYLYGQSDGGNSPVSTGVYSNANSGQFICKLSPDMSTVEWSTVIGSGSGSVDFSPIAFLVDNCDYVYWSGHSATAGIPTSTGAIQTSGGFYLGVLDPGGVSLNYATYYGGPGDHVDGGTSRFDPAGIVYQGVCTNNGFNTTPGAVDNDYPSPFTYDIGVFKIDFEVNPLYAEAAVDPDLVGCAPFNANFINSSSGGTYEWFFGDGNTSTAFEPSHTYNNPGIYTVMLVAHDPAACNQYDTSFVTVTVIDGNAPTADFTYDVNCATQSVTCTYTGTPGAPLSWDMGDGTILTGDPVSHTYSGPGTYTVTLTAGSGICATPDTHQEDVTVGAASITPTFNIPTCHDFSDGSIVLNVNGGGTGSETFSITDTSGTELIVGASNAANNLSSGWYYFFVDLGNGCTATDSVFLENPFELLPQMSIEHVACNGDATGIVEVDTVLNWQGDYNQISYHWNPNPCGISGIGADSCGSFTAGNYVLTINDDNGCSNSIDFTINEPPPLVLTELGTEEAYCRIFHYQSGNGVVYAAAGGGTPDYDYEWINLTDPDTTNNTTWGGLNPGEYQVTVVDDHGCVLVEQITLDSLNPIAGFDMISNDFDIEWEGTAEVCVTFENTSQYYENPNNPSGTPPTFLWTLNRPDQPWVITHIDTLTLDTCYADGGEYTICVVAVNKNGCQDTMCTDITIYDPWAFEPVNIFTPNGDGDNDEFTFEFVSQSVETFSAIIVNRWGVTVAEINDIAETWDGTDKNGSDCPDGVYFYTYEGTQENVDANGDKIPFSGQGNVTIVRGQ